MVQKVYSKYFNIPNYRLFLNTAFWVSKNHTWHFEVPYLKTYKQIFFLIFFFKWNCIHWAFGNRNVSLFSSISKICVSENVIRKKHTKCREGSSMGSMQKTWRIAEMSSIWRKTLDKYDKNLSLKSLIDSPNFRTRRNFDMR